MGIAVQMFPAESDLFQHRIDKPGGLFPALHHFVGKERFCDDIPDRHPRVQGGIGVLKDHLHILPERLQTSLTQPCDLLPLKIDLPLRRLIDPYDSACESGFSTAGLPDNSQRPSTLQRKAHPFHRVNPLPPSQLKILPQTAHIEERARFLPLFHLHTPYIA